MPVPEPRRQVSLFVPPFLRDAFDDVRRRADPVQHALIPAHATLVRDEDVRDWNLVRERVLACTALALELSVGTLGVDELGGAFLPLVPLDGGFSEWRARLLHDQPGRTRKQAPHLTLRHPRNRATFGLSVDELRAFAFPARIRFDRVVLIEQVEGRPWRVVAEGQQA